ncbi:binding-protein-dependent transport system inner membrane protein [Paenibacillus sp. FSL R7-277]|uniref:carbohydrate ABC transporter permease n=1 Tax=unclassified Paenibacillus TaxID=185978 RepID=UPI0003E1CAB5|nr:MULTISPECIES: carbohydrate ABC transporter permease [unclassified Paenibacillus]ETT30206.1 binding-protein-dependent transport system inner membrane protein [Paenibacillus sp. FSL R7-269]ETT72871.1 binding-protein-dependent transport system inner membrane protein [Paenibacillus sp. FSL R7-277]OMF94168.1 sugar ABC transporter ATP-binding protein [Paenibacillus sp. FSL R7-0337]
MTMKKLKPGNLIFTVLFALCSVFFLMPLVWMLSAASKTEKEVWTFPIQWIPTDWNLIANFKAVWMGDVAFGLFYMNSLKIALISTLATIVISAMAGYALAKLDFKGRALIFTLMLAFMMIPEQATLVPRYIMIKELGLYDSHAALILMGMFSSYFTFLLRQFMIGIHNDMLEAAELDGAGFLRIFWSVVLPLSRPILATVGIIKFIWTWNDYQGPLIMLNSTKLYTIPLGMQFFKEEFGTQISVMMMASVAAILPLLVLFLILQKQVINGIAIGGVKG